MFRIRKNSRFMRTATLGTAAALIALSGCISVAGQSSAATKPKSKAVSGLPKVIKIDAISDLTGAAGLYGQAEEKGWNLAVKAINNSKLLGKSKIVLSVQDDTSSTTVAASLASAAVPQHYAVVICAPASANAVVEAPIFTAAGQVTVFNQAGSSGVLISPWMFRLTPTAANQYPAALKYLQSKGVTSVADIYLNDNPTLTGVDQVISTDASMYGLTDLGHVGISSTTTDVTSAVTSLLALNPGAVSILINGAAAASVVSQLRQDGYTGTIIAYSSIGVGVLAPLGAAANGVVWPSDWINPGTSTISQNFANAFQAAYGAPATNFSAESYDSMFFIADALKLANSVTESKIRAAMNSVGAKGFNGVLGNNIQVINGQEQVTAHLEVWVNGGAVPLS